MIVYGLAFAERFVNYCEREFQMKLMIADAEDAGYVEIWPAFNTNITYDQIQSAMEHFITLPESSIGLA